MPMPDLTPAERAAYRKALVAIWRFWNSDNTPEAEATVDDVIDAVVELVKEMDR